MTPDGFELRVSLAPRDRDRIARVLDRWLREQARFAIDATVADHAAALGVGRWRSASAIPGAAGAARPGRAG